MNAQGEICHYIPGRIQHFAGSPHPLEAFQTSHNETITIEIPGGNSGCVRVEERLDIGYFQSRFFERALPLLHRAKRLVMVPGSRLLRRIFDKKELSPGD